MTDIQLAIKIISLFENLNCLKFQETEKSGAIYYIPQGGPLRPLIYCFWQNLFVQDIQSGDTPLGQLMCAETGITVCFMTINIIISGKYTRKAT